MRRSLARSALALIAFPLGLAAQDIPKKPIVPGAIPQGTIEKPQLPSKPVLQTIAVSSFDLRQATSGFQLVAAFQGMTPTHYQVSEHSDFRNATWLAWPSTNRPIWSGGGDGSACGPNIVKIVANFRVRAFRTSTQTFTVSNAVRDTVCLPFG